jgi:hypothetical protein
MIIKKNEKDLSQIRNFCNFFRIFQDKNSIDSQNINFSKRAYRKKTSQFGPR